MATVCGCCLAMLDAGVPLKSSVAGVAMGLILGAWVCLSSCACVRVCVCKRERERERECLCTYVRDRNRGSAKEHI